MRNSQMPYHQHYYRFHYRGNCNVLERVTQTRYRDHHPTQLSLENKEPEEPLRFSFSGWMKFQDAD